MFDEHTGQRIAHLASRGLQDPLALSAAEIREVCASALTQVAPRSLTANALISGHRNVLAGETLLSRAMRGG